MRNAEQAIRSAQVMYNDERVKKLYLVSSIIEKKAYEVVRGTLMPVYPRIREIIEFCKMIDAKKLGVAFCTGLHDEAARVTTVLEESGFTVLSVRCKCGAIDKTDLSIPREYKIRDPNKYEAACNPIAQAQILNEAGTDLNIIVGLCVGHDILFTMHSKAPVTTLIVKDRLLGHNPLIALYSNYHKNIIKP
ncbi:DUF1847 domain-containing protein [Candidatus Bathyarchaeota archaeon]|nr:DUF1847 domain-containing protein [Candidatus Bathyarchaeota archaeon]